MYNTSKFDNSLEIVKDFYTYYFNKLQSQIKYNRTKHNNNISKMEKNIYSKNIVFKKRDNVMIYNLFKAYQIFLSIITTYIKYVLYILFFIL